MPIVTSNFKTTNCTPDNRIVYMKCLRLDYRSTQQTCQCMNYQSQITCDPTLLPDKNKW